MKKALWIFTLILFGSCQLPSSSVEDRLEEVPMVDPGKKNKVLPIENTKRIFNIEKYKQSYDSIMSDALNRNVTSTLKIDSLSENDFVFPELRSTVLSNIPEIASSVIKYRLLIDGEGSGWRHSIIIIDFSSQEESNDVFKKIESLALEKSGVPGLTYSHDYLFQVSVSRIIWLNSNCGISYANHLKFTKTLNKLKEVNFNYFIDCRCGAVTCKLKSSQ